MTHTLQLEAGGRRQEIIYKRLLKINRLKTKLKKQRKPTNKQTNKATTTTTTTKTTLLHLT